MNERDVLAPDTTVRDDLLEHLVAVRRDLHRNPELSNEEHRTSGRIVEELERLGIASRTVAGTGVVAELAGRREGPRIALRADIDALPIQEENEVEYASQRPGVMHACGHDGHTTMLLGAARLLLERERELPVRLLFQPAEEKGTGARAMMAEGALDGVAAICGGHLDCQYPAGTMVVVDGPVNASTDGFRISVRTSGGHSARPHEGRDAVVAGCHLVTAIQTLVSRELNPANPAVITVGTFHAGTAGNIMAGEAEIRGTIRTLSPEVRRQMAGGLERIARAAGPMFEARIECEVHQGTPALINGGAALVAARRAAVRVVGEENLRPLATTNMGGEDFACYLEQVPGCFVRWGARPRTGPAHPAHSSRFDFDERALVTGARFLCEAALEMARDVDQILTR